MFLFENTTLKNTILDGRPTTNKIQMLGQDGIN